MKTVTRYSIRTITNNEYSKPLNYSQRLRDRKRALRLVKRLKSMGINAFAAPMKAAA